MLLEMCVWKSWPIPHSSSGKWCGWGQGSSSSGGRQALLYALSTFNTGVGIANPSLFCFPFQPHPFPFLARGPSLSPFAEIFSLTRLPSFSLHHLPTVAAKVLSSLQREQVIFYHWSSKFWFCQHTHNGCSGSAPVLGALQDFYRLPMWCQLHAWPGEDGSVWEWGCLCIARKVLAVVGKPLWRICQQILSTLSCSEQCNADPEYGEGL